MAPQPESHHVRGWVRSIDFQSAAGHSEQLIVEIRLADIAGREVWARWRSEHYLGAAIVSSLEIRHGDEVELHIDADAKGHYTRDSYIEDHTRNIRYTLVKGHRAGCFTSLALLVCVPARMAAAGVFTLIAHR